MGLRQRILNPDRYIKRFMAKEVKTGQLFMAGGVPHPEGLLSPDIFGATPDEKRVMVGYIKLPTYFIHPEIYRGFFKRRMRYIDNIINGTKKYTIQKDGTLLEDPAGSTGIKWFYDNYDNIKFKASEEGEEDRVMSTNIKKSFNRLTRDQIFMNKLIVVPLIVRDINTSDGKLVKVDEINAMYQSVLSLSQYYSNDNNNLLIDRHAIAYRIQLKLVELFTYAFDKIFGKDGIQRKKAMGRNIDYTSRNIISAPKFTGKFGSSPYTMDNAGYPLSAVIGSFTPIFIYNLHNFFKHCYDIGVIHDVSLDEFEVYYDLKFCKSLIDKYIKSWSERLDKVSATAGKDKSVIELDFKIHNSDGTLTDMKKPVSLIGIFYMIGYVTVELANRVTAITRYPILNKYNCVVTKIHILSTHKTVHVSCDGIDYPYYPDIFNIEKDLATKDPDKREEIIGSLFQETIKMSNVFLKGFNGDYDGMTVASYSNI